MATKKGDLKGSPPSAPSTTTPATNGKPQDRIEFVDDNLKHGFAQVPRLVIRAKGLSCQAKVLYALLLDYAWQNDSCFPGQERLSQDIGKSIDTVQRTLNELRDYRLVEWKQQGLNRPNIYYILRLSECCFLHPDTNLSGTPQICGIQKPHNCGIQKPHQRGTKNTKSKDTQVNNTQHISRGKASKTKKEGKSTGTRSHIAHTAIGNEKTSSKSNGKTQTDRTSNGEASKIRPNVGAPITQDELDTRRRNGSGLTSIGDIMQGKLQAMQVQASGPQQVGSPSGQNGKKPQGRSHAAPEFIQGIVGDFAREMGDAEHAGSCITRAWNDYLEFARIAKAKYQDEDSETINEAIYDAFYNALYDARKKAKAATIKKVNGQGRANRMPYFFSCLEHMLGLKDEQQPGQPTN